ncbi:maestro heat-like repeat-containing protein family member 1 [Amia ocellicauda]|uniref:maestro heat-like repeat-containing protein family member 1 n=1 Tax=Amia ocellicauda TaxID=2972642 RepID=UPI003464A966
MRVLYPSLGKQSNEFIVKSAGGQLCAVFAGKPRSCGTWTESEPRPNICKQSSSSYPVLHVNSIHKRTHCISSVELKTTALESTDCKEFDDDRNEPYWTSQVGPFYNEKQARLVQLCVGAVLSRPSEAVSEAYFEVFSGDTCGLFALITATLTQDVCLETLEEMLEPLLSSCSSLCNVAKVMAMTLVSAVLGIYGMMSVTRGSGLVPVAGLLASLVPRCCDPEPVVAQQAVTSIKMALDMWLYYEDGYIDDEKMDYIRQWIKDESSGSDSCVALVQIVSECLRPRHRQTLIQGLLTRLHDPQPSSAQACCALLCQLLSSHQDELTELLPQVLHGFLGLSGAEDSVRQSVKEGVLWLVFQGRALAIESLISHPAPADHTIRYQLWRRELWGAIGASNLGPWTFRALVEKLQSATRSQASVACAVQDVLAELSQEAFTFAEVFAALLPLLGVEDSDGDFAVQGFVANSLKVLLSRAQLGEVALQQDWGLIREPGQQPEGIFRLTRALKTFAAPVLPEVVQLLWQRYGSADRGQKICIAAFFAGLLRQPHPTDPCLLTEVRNLTLQMCEEPLEDVCHLAMQGLKAEPTEMHRYATEQLKLLKGALSQYVVEGKWDILSAVSSLVTILRFCEDGTAQRIIPKLYHTAKECLENPDSEIRWATVLLLGQLVKAASMKSSLQKQCHGSLAMLLLHLQDPLPAASQACQRTLRQCAPALSCPTLTDRGAPEPGDFGFPILREGRGRCVGESLWVPGGVSLLVCAEAFQPRCLYMASGISC